MYVKLSTVVRWGIISFIAEKKANLYEYVLTSQPVEVDFADWLLTAHTKWI